MRVETLLISGHFEYCLGMRKLLALFLVSLIFQINGAVAASEVEWRPVIQQDSQDYVMNILGLSESTLNNGGDTGSLLQYNSPTATGYSPKKCDYFGDSVCTKDRIKSLQAGLIYPVCENQNANWCISGFSSIDKAGNAISAKFIRYIDGNTYPANSEIGLPEGGRISIWRLGNQSDSDPIYFAVRINSWMRWFTEKPFYFQSSGSIYPIKLVENTQYKQTKILDLGSGIGTLLSGIKCENAVFISNGICGVLDSFPEDIRFKLSINVPNEVTGFISSRMSRPKLDSKPINLEMKQITLEGEPLRIPRLGLVLTRDQALRINPALGPNKMNWMAFDNSQNGDTLQKFDLLKEWSNDRSTGASRVWNFSTLDSSNSSVSGVDVNGKQRIDYVSKCKIPPSDLLGSISTNAMVLDPGPPNFLNDEFVYNVAGMHFESDGVTAFKGYYSLLIGKSLAKCLYVNSSVPIRAVITITDADGSSKQVSTETVQELENVYSINISGFTFSKPIIRIKYEYSVSIKPSITPTPTPSPTSSSGTGQSGVNTKNIRFTTIICTKGKKTKLVTAVLPKCPTGYKKK